MKHRKFNDFLDEEKEMRKNMDNRLYESMPLKIREHF